MYAKYLLVLEKLRDDFGQRRVTPLAICLDTAVHVQALAGKTNTRKLRFAYDPELPMVREGGLTIPTSRGKTCIGIDEPTLLSELGLFLVRPDGTLFWGCTQSMRFARLHFDEILGALDFVAKNDYPARGECRGPRVTASSPPDGSFRKSVLPNH